VAAGRRLGYAPKAVVGHPARHSWAELQQKWRRLNREMFLLEIERPGGRFRWLLKSLALPLSALAHIPKVLASDQLTTLRERMMAISILFAIRFWRCPDALGLLLRPTPAAAKSAHGG
jgi:hypothetical protein